MTVKNHHNQKISHDIDINETAEEHKIDAQVHQFANLGTESSFEAESDDVKSMPIIAWIVAFMGLVVGLLLSYYAFKGFLPSNVNVSAPIIESSTPTPTPLVSPTASPQVVKDRSSVVVHVLNGSGTPGLAGVAKSQLESLGYKNIETGNADSFDYEKTQVSVRPGLSEIGNLVITDLKDKYSLDTQLGTLPITGTYDVEIILGSE